MSIKSAEKIPLCVDLDGTLLKTDVFWEGMVRLLRRRPWSLFRLPGWLGQGRAFLKAQVASRTALDVTALPYRQAIIERIQQARAEERPVWLVTAADVTLAERVARHVGGFDGVIASDGAINIARRQKAAALQQRFGQRGFDYAGNAWADVPVWAAARRAIVVSHNAWLIRAARRALHRSRPTGRAAPRVEVVREGRGGARALLAALRPHQWVKNTLVFVPLLAAHRGLAAPGWAAAAAAFVALSLVASALYIVNDLMDVETDRRHPTKRRRPLAAGDVSVPAAASGSLLLLAGGFVLGSLISWTFVQILLVYAAGSGSYSFWLKRLAVVDVVLLSALYMLRLMAGAAATAVMVSRWLLLFSIFFFLSLALLKRYAELFGGRTNRRRGYRLSHRETIWAAGAGSGFMAVVVLALYARRSPQAALLYQRPVYLWLVCAVLLFWLGRVWLLARRGRVDDEVVSFALRDGVSYAAGAAVVGLLWLAA